MIKPIYAEVSKIPLKYLEYIFPDIDGFKTSVKTGKVYAKIGEKEA